MNYRCTIKVFLTLKDKIYFQYLIGTHTKPMCGNREWNIKTFESVRKKTSNLLEDIKRNTAP